LKQGLTRQSIANGSIAEARMDAWVKPAHDGHRLRGTISGIARSPWQTTDGSEPMPIILWLLGVPLSIVIVLWLIGVV